MLHRKNAEQKSFKCNYFADLFKRYIIDIRLFFMLLRFTEDAVIAFASSSSVKDIIYI